MSGGYWPGEPVSRQSESGLFTDAKGMICTKTSVMMFTRVCIISTMNDAEDYAGLMDNAGVVVSVQLSSGWRKTWPEAPSLCCNAGIIVHHFAPSHHISNTVYNRRNSHITSTMDNLRISFV